MPAMRRVRPLVDTVIGERISPQAWSPQGLQQSPVSFCSCRFDLTDRDSFFDSKTRSTIVSRRPGIASSEGAPGDPSDHFISLKLLRVEASSNCL